MATDEQQQQLLDERAFILRVLRVFEFEATDELWWRTDTDGSLYLAAMCNDVFAWGCSDLDRITPDNVEVLEQARADIAAATETSWPFNIGLLFCARLRKMRPQGAMYNHLDKRTWPLFDACGPERDTGMGNPCARPDDDA